ncbi:MAG: carbon storage regulator CsrA [Fidelibacterota bacterium]
MLVLTRKKGEKIQVGQHIVITVLSNEADQIKLGIQAPREIPIYREEVYNKIRNKNRESIMTSTHVLENLFNIYGKQAEEEMVD